MALDLVTRLSREFAHAAKGGEVKTFEVCRFGVGERSRAALRGARSIP
jgi:hypothetical protein